MARKVRGRLLSALITAAIIQQVWIGGGFGTGREVVEYIARFGALGWLSIAVSAATLAIALVLTFEVARVFKAFDYASWSKQFLGRFTFLFDIVYIALAWVVIAVVGAATGHILEDIAGIPFAVGATAMILAVAVLHFYGRKAFESTMVVGVAGLGVMYAVIISYALMARGGVAASNLATGLTVQNEPGFAAVKGFQYMLYNLYAVVPAIQSVDRYVSIADSFAATALSLLLVYGIAALIWICFMGFYPDVRGWNVPWYEVLKSANAPAFVIGLYVFWIFYTLVATALGMVYSIVLRVNKFLEAKTGRKLSKKQEAAIVLVALVPPIILSRFGIVELVDKGYGMLAWAFFAVYFLPLTTVGLYRLIKARKT